jgi:hypothetical protein
MFNNFIFENRALYWINKVEQRMPQMKIWRMCNACWIPNFTNPPQSIAFPLQHWSHEPSSMLRYTYIAYLIRYKQKRHRSLIWTWKCNTFVLEYYYFSRAPWSLKKKAVYSIETSNNSIWVSQHISTEYLPSVSENETRKHRPESVSWPTADIPTDIASTVCYTKLTVIL